MHAVIAAADASGLPASRVVRHLDHYPPVRDHARVAGRCRRPRPPVGEPLPGRRLDAWTPGRRQLLGLFRYAAPFEAGRGAAGAPRRRGEPRDDAAGHRPGGGAGRGPQNTVRVIVRQPEVWALASRRAVAAMVRDVRGSVRRAPSPGVPRGWWPARRRRQPMGARASVGPGDSDGRPRARLRRRLRCARRGCGTVGGAAVRLTGDVQSEVQRSRWRPSTACARPCPAWPGRCAPFLVSVVFGAVWTPSVGPLLGGPHDRRCVRPGAARRCSRRLRFGIGAPFIHASPVLASSASGAGHA